MRFGSVEFFKVLIKVVLAIFFFVPLALAIVFSGQSRAQSFPK